MKRCKPDNPKGVGKGGGKGGEGRRQGSSQSTGGQWFQKGGGRGKKIDMMEQDLTKIHIDEQGGVWTRASGPEPPPAAAVATAVAPAAATAAAPQQVQQAAKSI